MLEKADDIGNQIIGELKKVIIGQNSVLEQIVITMFAGGHALLEGVPGTGKTLLIKALSHIMGTTYKRVQFTPDLMPSDIIGVNIFDTANREFTFRPGPIFSDFFLADEINRSPAKTQSALLEAMEERQVTIDGVTHLLPDIFTVFATQNPIEFEGTYPLPEAQVDRFMLKIIIDYPQEADEAFILDNVENGFDASKIATARLDHVCNAPLLAELKTKVRKINVEEMVRRYITQIVRTTRSVHQITIGASPRAGVMLMLAAKARAFLYNRDFVSPDDVKTMALPVLRHRIILLPEAEVEGRTADDCIKDILLKTDVPR